MKPNLPNFSELVKICPVQKLWSQHKISHGRRPGLNRAITAEELRVIGQDETPLGILSRTEALKLAEEAGLDLVVVGPNSTPPIAKIIDWGKYNYQKKKKQQQIRQSNLNKQKSDELKRMRFNLKIGAADLEIKLKKVRQFLEEGCKVKLTIVLRGREMEHKELAFQMAEDINTKLGSVVVIQPPRLAGRQINMVIKAGR